MSFAAPSQSHQSTAAAGSGCAKRRAGKAIRKQAIKIENLESQQTVKLNKDQDSRRNNIKIDTFDVDAEEKEAKIEVVCRRKQAQSKIVEQEIPTLQPTLKFEKDDDVMFKLSNNNHQVGLSIQASPAKCSHIEIMQEDVEEPRLPFENPISQTNIPQYQGVQQNSKYKGENIAVKISFLISYL